MTKRLGFDEGAAGLRIHVARAARRRPELLGALAEGRVSLSVAALLVPHLKSENVERLLSDCAGKTKREAQEYLVGLAPRPVVTPGIRMARTAEAPAAVTTSVATAGAAAGGDGAAQVSSLASTPAKDRLESSLVRTSSEQPMESAAAGQPVAAGQMVRPKRRIGCSSPVRRS